MSASQVLFMLPGAVSSQVAARTGEGSGEGKGKGKGGRWTPSLHSGGPFQYIMSPSVLFMLPLTLLSPPLFFFFFTCAARHPWYHGRALEAIVCPGPSSIALRPTRRKENNKQSAS